MLPCCPFPFCLRRNAPAILLSSVPCVSTLPLLPCCCPSRALALAPVALFLLAFRPRFGSLPMAVTAPATHPQKLALYPRLSLLLLATHPHYVGSLPMAGFAPACHPSPLATALCPWLPLHGRVMRLLSALPCPRWGKGCEMRCTTYHDVSVVLLSCA